MGIDRIGKGPPPGSQPPAKPGETGKTFEVPPAKQAEHVERVGQPSVLEQLKSGKIDFDAYVQAKIDEATAHLHALPKVELDKIRSLLRDQLASDPTLADLVKQATGHTPEPPPEE